MTQTLTPCVESCNLSYFISQVKHHIKWCPLVSGDKLSVKLKLTFNQQPFHHPSECINNTYWVGKETGETSTLLSCDLSSEPLKVPVSQSLDESRATPLSPARWHHCSDGPIRGAVYCGPTPMGSVSAVNLPDTRRKTRSHGRKMSLKKTDIMEDCGSVFFSTHSNYKNTKRNSVVSFKYL